VSGRQAIDDIFAVIADPTRRKLLDRLGRGEMTVINLARPFDMTLSAVSQHLKHMSAVGIVKVRRDGRQRYYRLNARPLKTVADWVGKYERFWNDKLAALREHLDENPT
jgi:DNA-binding transcriptional ArsR family regulator